MIAARSWRTDITNILLDGEHIDLDIQENVSQAIIHFPFWSMLFLIRQQDGRLSISQLTEETLTLQKHSSRQEPMLTLKTRYSEHKNNLTIHLSSFPLIFGEEWANSSGDC